MKTRNYLLLIALAITLLTSCEKDKNCVRGSGSIVSHDYAIASFDELYLYGKAEVFITEASQTSLRIEGQENILNALNVDVKNGDLSIGNDNCFKESEKLTMYLSTPSLSAVKIEGLCDVNTEGIFSGASFRAEIDGSGSMDLQLDVQEFSAYISGDGDITATGKADTQTIRISGMGDMQLFDLEGSNGDITIDGSGDIEINVSEKLTINISGSGNIYYLGTPTITKDVSGIGNIISSNE